MKQTVYAACMCLLVPMFLGACVEETATDVPDQKAESMKGRGAPLKELVEVVSLEEGAVGSPFIDGIESLMTLEEALETVKEQPHFVSFDHTLEKRGVCPGLRTRMLEVDPWTDLGIKGKLTLTFYNGVLANARFGIGDLAAYKAASKAKRGVLIRATKQHRIEPYTNVWASILPPHSPIYSDIRMIPVVDSLTKACEFQRQIEKGISEPPA